MKTSSPPLAPWEQGGPVVSACSTDVSPLQPKEQVDLSSPARATVTTPAAAPAAAPPAAGATEAPALAGTALSSTAPVPAGSAAGAAEVEWASTTQMTVTQLRTLRKALEKSRAQDNAPIKPLTQDKDVSITTQQLNGLRVAQDKLKKRIAREQKLAESIARCMEEAQRTIFEAGQTISAIQRGSNAIGQALHLTERRLELRAKRPPTELIYDRLQEVLENERAVLVESRQHLSEQMKNGDDAIAELRAAKEKLEQQRLKLPLDRTGHGEVFVSSVLRLQEVVDQFCIKGRGVLSATQARVDKASTNTSVRMTKRVGELVNVKKLLEVEVRETRDAIENAERDLTKLQKMIKEYNDAPERKVEVESEPQQHNDRQKASDIFAEAVAQSPLLHKLRASIKAAAYTGGKGRQLDVVFSRFDKDHSGELDHDELRMALRRTLRITHSTISDAEIHVLCNALDSDKSGYVSINELVMWLSADTDTKQLEEQCQAIEASMEPLKSALQQLLGDLKSKSAALKIDQDCLRLTVIKAGHEAHAPVHQSEQSGAPTSARKRRPEPLAPDVLETVRSKIKSAAYTGQSGRQLEVVFTRFDKDKSGQLDDDEIRRVLRGTLRIPHSIISDVNIFSLCGMLDTDNSGSVSITELVNFIGPEPVISKPKIKSVMHGPKANPVVEHSTGQPIPGDGEAQLSRPRGPKLTPDLLETVRSKMKAAAYTGHRGKQLKVIFSRFDKDHSGQLGDDEVRMALRRNLKIPPSVITDAEISSLCAMLDADNSGTVGVSELVEFVGQEKEPIARLQLKATTRSHDLPSAR